VAGCGCGLLISGNMMVDRRAISEPRQVVIGHDASQDGLTSLARAAQRRGAAVWPSSTTAGARSPASCPDTPPHRRQCACPRWAPSATPGA
jgi:2,4-dienoyl-CoA reductase-like NADH-dependent reductase (Old Yellow Enzyme family)